MFANQAVIAIENVRLFNETKEALEQQTAISEVLRVISDSPTDVKPVLETVAMRAAKICDASDARIWLVEGDAIRHAAGFGDIPITVETGDTRPIERSLLPGRAILDRAPVHVEDIQAVSSEDLSLSREIARHSGWRTALSAPLLREAHALGAITLRRVEVRPFTEKQISLLKTFADQAAIAIENARLFNDLQSTNATLREALEQQTATGEILSVISSSPTNVQPVFDTIIRNAVRLCDGAVGAMFRYDGSMVHVAALYNLAPDVEELFRKAFPQPLSRENPGAQAILERELVTLEDVEATDYSEAAKERARGAGYRGLVAAPLMREGVPIGSIAVGRRVPGKFPDSYVALLKTFADQAVIAIENTRLFKEVQERTEALTKSVGQLTALGEVGQAISSTLDLEKVLKTIVQRAVQLAGLDGGSIYEFDDRDERFHLRAAEHVEEEILEVSRSSPIRLGEGAVGRAGATREPVVVEDVLDESYQSRVRELLIKSGSRALLAVPLLREDLLLGALVVSRNSPGPFVPEVIGLLKTFATQSAVAIQNARLFNETKEALEQQTASAEILKVIAASPSDVQPVFDAVAANAVRLCESSDAEIFRRDGDRILLVAHHGPIPSRTLAVPLVRETFNGRTVLDGRSFHVADLQSETDEFPRGSEIARQHGTRAQLSVPLMREGVAIGTISLRRTEARLFTDRQIALLQTFANQAVIAIENVRLFQELAARNREIEDKSRQLEVANKHKSDFLANMSHELRTPLNAIIGFSEALMDRMFGDLNEKQLEYQKDIHESGKHLLSLINDILDLSKIEAGRMELELSSFHLPTAISNAVTLIRERAMRHGIALGVEIDERLGEFQADERKLKQVLLNLLSNAVKFTPDGGRVDVSAKLDTDKVEISVKDTGVGISPEDQASLFEEFKQLGKDSSRKAEGTGLGLSLTKRLVELHGGQILVDSAVGHGSTFRVMLPMRGERLIE
jgi:signal transduction histidine kinase